MNETSSMPARITGVRAEAHIGVESPANPRKMAKDPAAAHLGARANQRRFREVLAWPDPRRALQPLAVDWSRNVWSDGSLAKRARTRQEHPLLSREYHRIPRLGRQARHL